MSFYASCAPDVLNNVSHAAVGFGQGFFETLLYNGKYICHLEPHVERLLSSLESFGIPYHKVDYEVELYDCVKRAGLEGQEAKLNIIYATDFSDAVAQPVFSAKAYMRSVESCCQLIVYPHSHDTFLARHKSLSYFPCLIARQYAQARGFDDAILLDSQRYFTETSKAAFLFRIEDQWCVSGVRNKLPSVGLALAESIFGPLAQLFVGEQDFTSVDFVYVVNSVMGMVPVQKIGEVEIDVDCESCEAVNRMLFSA